MYLILEEIAAATRKRIEEDKARIPFTIMKKKAEQQNTDRGFLFEKVLTGGDIHFICEVKKASPSKGIIADSFPYVDIAKEYEEAGASCVSVLTEPEFFQGSDKYLTEIKEAVNIPVLRKDFILDSYQIYQSRVIGADCILLICSLLEEKTIKEFIDLCDFLGLSALVEAHDEEEIDLAISAGARMIGVNNRNLKTFEVDIDNSLRLRSLVPDEILFVAESGIRSDKDILALRKAKVNAVLIGEALMKSPDKKKMIESLRGNYDQN
ncbi:MAG: Indole-3-glycerol phosphate synthase [Lachnoclostridium sp.]